MHNPFVPETLEGWSALHLMFRVDWGRLGQAYPGDRAQMAEEAAAALAAVADPAQGATTLVQLLGHKGDLMVIAFRRTFDDLGRVQLALSRTKLHAFLQPTTSYVSIVELGMYDMTAKVHRQLGEQGLTHGSDAYNTAFDEEMERQRGRVTGRLFTPIPPHRHVCFYPMNKRRGEALNWYAESFERRAEMMLEHGKVGREYAGKVTQIISGSIGFDDWEWGVDLFADDPLTFKKLIYEMRFDEASAKFAEFGPFYVGLQFPPSELGKFLEGELPQLTR
ncbi:MAG TPA: hydrogen peroxide-dependent heme synthase [Vicinamibacterales bacterium]|nr:hydrogen peroxide-dependent heme synthase [Vicinamibacterales bacterium]